MIGEVKLLPSTATVEGLAPVAQLDRVLASEAKGRRFESCQARHSGAGQEFHKSDKIIERVKKLATDNTNNWTLLRYP